ATHKERGGDWSRFGFESLLPGTVAMDALPFLVGSLPILAPHALPSVTFGAGVSADVWVFPVPDGFGLVAHDVSDRVRQVGRMQQEGYQLSLVNARLTGQGLGSAVRSGEDLLSLLKMAVFECDENGVCSALGTLAPWADPFVEPALAGQASTGRTLKQGDGLSFLDNFLEDAQIFWSSGQAGHLASGVWCEALDGGKEACFEALAALDEGGHRNLVIERVDARYAERQGTLQRARQAHLDFETLRGEVQKKEVLLQCIVHDLRAPLANMMGVLSLLKGSGLEPDKVRELLDLALRQAGRQDQMMRDLLEIFAAEVAALQSYDTDPTSAPDLAQVLRERIRERIPAFEQAQLRLELELPATPARLPVAAHADRLDRVLGNLLGNAAQFAPAGTEVRVEASLDLAATPAQVEVRVLDRGQGVPLGEQARLFDRFAQGAGSAGAAGLGLYFCRNAVTTWGGTCGYRDRAGGGAEFWIRLEYLGSQE
ncbi:MAG TPA: HAMP domain-containing sensor histidine kinase, partial [Planctomycetota bacterium]|nr:HAMP domain-containing sensor histidine kinase [Planctomycetota bacterium]